MTCCMEYQQQSCQEIPNSGTNTAVASTGVLLASAELLAPGGLTGDAIDDGAGPWAVPAKRPRDRERLENLAEIVAAIEAKQRLRDRTSNEVAPDFQPVMHTEKHDVLPVKPVKEKL